MKLSLSTKIATLLTITLSILATTIKPSHSNEFAEQKVDQGNFVAVAVPYNYKQYRLAIIEQIPNQNKCWQESGYNPTTVDLTLLNFDHADSCRKAVDTNGYTLRVNGNDDRVAYLLRLMPINGDIFLVADHTDPNLSDLIIGRTSGIAAAPIKINLEQGWQFTKRIYEGNVLNHIYLSNNSSPQDIATNPIPQPVNPSASNDPGNYPASTQPTVGVANNPNSNPQALCNPASAQPTVTSAAVDTITSILNPLTALVFQSYNTLFDQNMAITNNPQNPCP